jgi:hypothetical protein
MRQHASGLAAGESSIEVAATLVSPSRPSSVSADLTTPEVAEHLGRSVAWVKKHATELGGRIVDGAYRFPSIAVERRRTTTEKITLAGAPRASEPEVGRRSAAVLARLEAGERVVDIAVALEEPADFVLKVRESWLRAHHADGEGLVIRCGCGATTDPRTARCARCFARSRVLSNEQAAVLDGREPPEPGTCTCCGCGEDVGVHHADHVCSACSPRIAVALVGGRVVVSLGATVLRELTDVETRQLLARAVQATPATAAPLGPASPSSGVSGVVSIVKQALADASAKNTEGERRLAEVQAGIAELDRLEREEQA